ncbi:MAG: ECF transporter S component [Firmicutes bacterium]|nr:ECF transporter S component [Bacillota bacterium]
MKYRNLIITGMLLALGVILSRIVHLIPLPLPAYAFSPLHLPVFICAAICGWKYGLACGVLLPFLSYFVSGKPLLYPSAIAMAAEMAAYALVTAAIIDIKIFKIDITVKTFIAVLIAQIAGRIIGGAVTAALLGAKGETYLFKTFVVSYFLNTLPAIILQLVIIPPIAKSVDYFRLKGAA